jgi:hypothetical protein
LTKHVNGEFAIAADEPWLYSIRLFAPKPTRLRSLLMMQVDDRRVTVNSDFERVEVASD